MKRISIFFTLFIFSLIIITLPAFGKGKGSQGMVPYKNGTIKTIEGKIKSIKTIYNPVTKEKGLHLKVKTSSKEYTVHVCPQWYADKQQFKFFKGELLTIKGSAFIKDGEPNIYAVSIIRRFSSLSKSKQIRLAAEVMLSTDISSIADKYGISREEVKIIKKRVEPYFKLALFPEPLNLRNVDSGDGLWRERSTQDRQEKQEIKYRKMKKIK